MMRLGILFAWLFILIVVVAGTYKLRQTIQFYKSNNEEDKVERLTFSLNWFYAVLVLTILAGLVIVYLFLRGTIWESHFFEWLNLVVRVIHITFGIAWIGASFYFVFLENALNRTHKVRDELAGNLWAVHGGGFYYLEKFKIAPKEIPKNLHWFKYEAYFTWLSGIGLLTIVYYFNSKSIMIDSEVLDIQPLTAVFISIGSLVVGWLVYDLICKKLDRDKLVFTLSITILVILFAWFYAHVFSGRAAFIHFGAFLGTLMAANVFFVIIPGQKRMVEAGKKGESPNPEDGKAAMLRSYTNNYFTLPVLFVMVSNHFPSTFSNENQWIILIAITFGTAGIKHYLNLREKGQLSVWIMPISIIVLLGAAFATAPKQTNLEVCLEDVSFSKVQNIVQNRCMICHSENPSDEVWKVAPNGVKYDTPEQIYAYKDKIYQRSVLNKNMPFNNNQTGMTQEERDLINCWISQGAPK